MRCCYEHPVYLLQFLTTQTLTLWVVIPHMHVIECTECGEAQKLVTVKVSEDTMTKNN